MGDIWQLANHSAKIDGLRTRPKKYPQLEELTVFMRPALDNSSISNYEGP